MCSYEENKEALDKKIMTKKSIKKAGEHIDTHIFQFNPNDNGGESLLFSTFSIQS